MTRLGAFTEAEQLDFDGVLDELRDRAPPGGIAAELQVATKRGEIGMGTHNGLCPYTQQCETRRRRLSTYREGIPCHWVTFWNVAGCPIYQNGGNGK